MYELFFCTRFSALLIPSQGYCRSPAGYDISHENPWLLRQTIRTHHNRSHRDPTGSSLAQIGAESGDKALMCIIMCRGVYGELGVRRDGSQNTARGNHVPKSDGVEQSRHVFQAAVEASTKFT